MSLEFQFILSAFACFRVAQLISIDDIFTGFRLWIARHSKFFSRLVTCPYCTGLWAAILISGLWFVLPNVLFFIVILPFAIAGAQSALQRVAGNDPL